MKPQARHVLTLRVLGALHRRDWLRASEIAKALDEPHDKIGVTLRRMLSAGLARRTSTTPHHYALTDAGRMYRSALLIALGVKEEAA